MAKEKKSIKKIYEEILSDEYDNEVADKIEKLKTIDEQDYEAAEEYYKNYLRILDGVVKSKDKSSLKKWKKKIIKESPWKRAVKKSKESLYRGIADSDREILLPLLKEEIQILNKENLNDLEKISRETSSTKFKIGATPAENFFAFIFRDFEQAFDGNFENPRVIFLGINPKIEKLDHEDYKLEDRFSEPFNKKRPVLLNTNENKDYYFGKGSFFFSTFNSKDEKIKTEFINRVIDETEITPFAFWEFYPYATMNQKSWYKEIEIRNGKIKKYFEWRIVLPSQIWLLCLLSYAIKKAQFENKELILYCTKKNAPFAENTMMPLVDILEIDKNKRICILTSKSQSRVFSKGNIKAYPKKEMPKFIKLDSNKEFFASVWGIGKESENNFS